MTWIPGGILIPGFGGQMVVRGYTFPNGSQGSPSRATVLDVGRWLMNRIYNNDDVTHSGCLGAIAQRRVGLRWQARAEIPWDVQNPPDLLLQSGNTVEVTFWIGPSIALPDFGAGMGYPQGTGLTGKVSNVDVGRRRCYWSPSGLLDRATTVGDSTGTKIVRQDVEMSGNSLIFLLPDEEAIARLYMSAIGFPAVALPTD